MSIYQQMQARFDAAQAKVREAHEKHLQYLKEQQYKKEKDEAEFKADLKDFMAYNTKYPGSVAFIRNIKAGLFKEWERLMRSNPGREQKRDMILKISVLLDFFDALDKENVKKFEQYRQFFDTDGKEISL